MNFWQFIDKQIGRLRTEAVAGAGIFLLTIIILFIIVARPEMAKDDLFKMLAQAIVVQGLVGLAMAAWFTKRTQEVATGKPDDPVHTEDDSSPDWPEPRFGDR